MSSGVRILDGLGHQPRSKTVLNGKQLLVAGAGRRIVLAQAEDGTAEAPTSVLIFPADQVFETIEFDFEKEKFVTYKVTIDRKWLEKLKTNSLAAWGEKDIPWYRHHNWRDEAHGWTTVAELEIDDEGMWARVEWLGDTAQKIAERRYRYVSPGWVTDYRLGGKPLGAVLYEVSLTNSPYFTTQPGLAAEVGDLLIAAAVPVDAAAQDEEAEMLEKLKELLGLKAEATEEEVGAAVELAVKAGAEMAEIDKALEGVDGADRAAKLATLTADEEADAEADTGKGADAPDKGAAGMGADAAEVLVEAAVAAGRVPPKGEAREKLAKALAALSVADAKEVLSLVGAGVPKGGDLKSKADGGADGAAPDLRETVRKTLGLSREAMEKYAPDKVATN